MKKILLIIAIISYSIFAKNKVGQIDDEDQSSINIGGAMITTKEAIKSIGVATKVGVGTAEGVKGVKAIKAAGGLKKIEMKNVKSAIKDKAKEVYFQYKSENLSIMPTMNRISKKLTETIGKASKKINQWRTTLPTLTAFAKNTKRMVDGTVELFDSLKVSDLYDIDRKWSRKFDANMRAHYRNTQFFSSWMTDRYWEVNTTKEKTAKSLKKKTDIFVGEQDEIQRMQEEAKKITSEEEIQLFFEAYMVVTGGNVVLPADSQPPFSEIPKRTLVRTAEVLQTAENLLNESKGKSASGDISKENAMMEKIAKYITKKNPSYADVCLANNMLLQNRAKIKTQIVEFNQLSAILARDYSRLLYRKKENMIVGQTMYMNNLTTLSGNEEKKTYQEIRKELLKGYLK